MAIMIADTGNIDPSISAAARAVGVDPSNARKAVLGQRKSAGGYTFVKVAAAPMQKEHLPFSPPKILCIRPQASLLLYAHRRDTDI